MTSQRAELDASAVQLDLRMTEGDPIAFAFTVEDGAGWDGLTWLSHIKTLQDSVLTQLGEMTVATVVNGVDLDVTLTSAAIPELTAVVHTYYWDMQESGGLTRFTGRLYVEPQVTAP